MRILRFQIIIIKSISLLILTNTAFSQVNPYSRPTEIPNYPSLYVERPVELEAQVMKELSRRYRKNANDLSSLMGWVERTKTNIEHDELKSELNKIYADLRSMKARGNIEDISDELRNERRELRNWLNKYEKYQEKRQELSTFLKKGQKSLENENYRTALDHFDKAIAIDTDKSYSYLMRGVTYYKAGNFEDAKKDLNHVISNSPNSEHAITAYFFLGWCKIDLEDYQKAIKDFNYLLENDSKSPEYYFGKGFAYSNLGQYKKANNAYHLLIDEKPDHSMAYNNLGWNHFKLKNMEKAKKYINKALEINTKNYIAWDSRCELLIANKEYKNAINSCDRAIKFNEDYANAYFNRGKAKLQLNKKEEGCKDLNKAGEKGIFDAFQLYDKKCND